MRHVVYGICDGEAAGSGWGDPVRHFACLDDVREKVGWKVCMAKSEIE